MSKYTYKLNIEPNYDENINAIYGIWELADKHQGGVTVKYESCTYPGEPSYWTNVNYTLAELTSDYTKEGKENPSKEAYESMQKELRHYMEGYLLTVTPQIWLDDILLAEDCIGTDFSDEYWDSEQECAEDCAKCNFSLKALIKEAKVNSQTIINKLST